ncbi:MAG: hypothetical protein ACXVZW_02600 [Gaiellaceae bacterium]
MPIQARIRRAAFPLFERAFTYRRYDDLLVRLVVAGCRVVPLREFSSTRAGGDVVVGLRHDVDESLESALELARLEHDRGLRATYFVLHTAAYWARPDLIPLLRELQDRFGHEIGWHNDLVTAQCIYGIEPRSYLQAELRRLREGGIRISGVASHGSSYCYRFGYHNNYFFSDFDEAVPGFPSRRVVRMPKGEVEIEQAALSDFGLDYEAYHLDNDLYYSDTSSGDGKRWHPDRLDVGAMAAGSKAIILIHPCHWDPSGGAKLRRLARLLLQGRWRRLPDPVPS